MADVHTKEIRSKNMRAIKSKNTKPELILRRELHRRGFRFRLHDKSLPGKPDLVLKKYRTAIFIHGCFWHMHDCRFFRLPKTNSEFWKEKLISNVERDVKSVTSIKKVGFDVIIVWECEIKEDPVKCFDRIERQLKESVGNC